MQDQHHYIRFHAWIMGFRDGWRAPTCLSSGITWTDGPWLEAGANEAYDGGVNAGQRLRSPRNHERAGLGSDDA